MLRPKKKNLKYVMEFLPKFSKRILNLEPDYVLLIFDQSGTCFGGWGEGLSSNLKRHKNIEKWSKQPCYKLQKILNCAQNPLLQEAKKYSNVVKTPLVEGAKISKWYIFWGGAPT